MSQKNQVWKQPISFYYYKGQCTLLWASGLQSANTWPFFVEMNILKVWNGLPSMKQYPFLFSDLKQTFLFWLNDLLNCKYNLLIDLFVCFISFGMVCPNTKYQSHYQCYQLCLSLCQNIKHGKHTYMLMIELYWFFTNDYFISLAWLRYPIIIIFPPHIFWQIIARKLTKALHSWKGCVACLFVHKTGKLLLSEYWIDIL